MSNYDHMLTLTIPASVYEIGCKIARAMDSDVGGADSWGAFNFDATEYTTTTPCTADFYTQALAMLSAPEMLHYAVTQDYAARWADLVPPTLAECQAFCNGVVMDETAEPAPIE